MRVIKSQLEIQALAGADDFTININDYLTIPIEQEPDHCNLLISERDRLLLIQEARRGKKAKGFGLPWKKDTAAKMTSRRGNINDILPKRNIDRLIAQFGLPTQFDAGFGNVILGDAVNCYDDNEIRSFLSNGLMIDGQALENLCSRGFEKLVGCCPWGFIGVPSIERLDKNEYSGRFAGGLITTNWIGLDTDKLYIY
ncbi:MAG: hypothetical protein FIA99_18425, partial [Ruminiclostridium sp.]|nr:hypothetical protein [Ruminiclostridium sp.]